LYKKFGDYLYMFLIKVKTIKHFKDQSNNNG
jgi:hypothetical protein